MHGTLLVWHHGATLLGFELAPYLDEDEEWNRATMYTQYANCWPTQSMQLLSNIYNKIA